MSAAPASALLVVLGLSAPVQAAAPRTSALTDAQLVASFREFQRHAHHPVPMPSPGHRAKLLAGKIVKMRLPSKEGEPVGAMALVISTLSKEEIWLGTADDEHMGEHEELITHHLPLLGDEMFRWYGYVDLPRPISDRHFLIQTTVDTAAERATDGRIWTRHWELEPGGEATMRKIVATGAVKGVDAERFEDAVWVPANQGAWIFVELPDDRTLFGYTTAASLGGNFPDNLVNRYVYWGLERVMDNVLAHAAKARTHYTGSHSPITGGNGKPIPTW
jgi:hypothetical protein